VGRTALVELLASTPVPTELVLTTLLNELAAAPDEVWLVLDDYHLVDDHEVGRGMAFLLDHLPPNIHVVLCTRADPDLPLARWRARGEMVEIRAADLRFTSEETAAYLAHATGHELAAEDVEVLEERTEGWIAALQLAALSLRGRSDVSGFVARFAGDDRYIVDYLIEEVLAQVPAAVRQFLMQSAVLDRLTGPLCDAVTGRGDGSEMIQTLERSNLFIVALDDRREWYRYHHLFADVLRARLLTEQKDEVPLLHQRASHWYERHDRIEEAVRHALAGRDFDRAAHLMELAVSTIRRYRREATMHGWLRALPDDTVRRSPVLSLFYGSMRMASGDLSGVEPWLDDAERALAAIGDSEALPWAETTDLRTLPSTIAMYRAAVAQARGDATGTAEHARRALDLAGPDDHLARGGAAGFLGFAAWATGDVSGAVETFTQAVASLRAAGSIVDALSSTVVLSDLWLVAGQPDKARRLCAQALAAAEDHGVPARRAIAELHVALSEMDTEVGDLQSAEHHLATAAAPADLPMTESRYRWFVAKGLLVRAAGDAQGAVQLLDQAEQFYRPGFFPEVRPIAAIRARIWIEQGRLVEAAGWAHERGVSVTDEARYLSEYDHLTLVRLLIAQHRARPDRGVVAQADRLLDRLSEAAETSGRAGSVAQIRHLQDLVQDAQGRRPQAPSPIDSLSERELDVLRLLDSELTGPEIARELFVSHNTVRTHTKHIFTKLDVTNRRAAVLRAREQGLI
jgi:LuxR family maltose regulon positive regulatory protein